MKPFRLKKRRPLPRALPLALALLLLVLSLPFGDPALAYGRRLLRGDVSGDGKLTATDYLQLKRFVLGTYSLSGIRLTQADVNEDGKRNSSDYLMLKRVVMGNATFENPDRYIEEGTERYETAVSVGKPYTASISPADNYPDVRNAELTNGLFADRKNATYSDTRLAGFPAARMPMTVTVDLGSRTPGLYRFEISYLSTREAAVGPLEQAEVSLSDDGESFVPAGSLSIPPYARGMQTAVLTLNETAWGRFVRFRVVGEAHWVFLDEVTVIADLPGTEEDESYRKNVESLYGSDGGTSYPVSGESPDRNRKRVDVAPGCAYVLTGGQPDPGYPDPDGTKLTDREIGGDSESDAWVGFSGTEEHTAVLDLGEIRSDLAAFEAVTCAHTPSGIRHPARVDVSVSVNGTSWTEAGRCYAPLSDKQSSVFRYVLELPNAVRARYVRFRFAESACSLILVGELSAFVYSDSEPERDPVYPPVVLPEPDGETFWEGSPDELSLRRNLLAGLPVQIELPGGALCTAPSDNTPSGSLVLTDGKAAPNINIHSGAYVKFRGDAARLLYFDLGKTVSVESLRLSFVYVTSWAIHLPGEVFFLSSTDGRNWYSLGSVRPSSDRDECMVSVTYDLPEPAAVRFLCLRMDIPGWVGLDEIEAFGTRGLRPETVYPVEAGYPSEDPRQLSAGGGWAAPSPDLLEGAGDIFLAYHGAKTVRTEGDLLYQVACCAPDGTILDTMFDGVLFLMAGGFPSGLGGGTGGVLNYNRSDVEWMLGSLFEDGCNVSALNDAAGRVKTALSLPDDFRVRYYLSFYRPSCDDFGDIDGDGIGEDLSGTDGKLKVLRWILDRTEEAIAAHPFEHLTFGGYYWYNESMAGDGSDKVLLNEFVPDVHSYGRQLFWIPYYSALGWSEWKAYGLDSACLQPNYAFSPEVPDSRLELAARLASAYGMSVEIEMDSRSLTDDLFLDRYFAYLEHGARMGFMTGSIHLYYMAGGSLSRFAASESPLRRLLYENTYHFIKKDLQTAAEPSPDRTFESGTSFVLEGTVGENDGTYVYKLRTSPSHGTVSLESDGTFTYYPDPGYAGTDSFTFVRSRHMADSEPASVCIVLS